MTIEQLKYFAMVAKCLNFNKAAEQLFVAQSTLSSSIAKLEQELNVTLFDRSKKSVSLTRAGEVFAYDVDDILERMTAAVERARFANNKMAQLHIGFLGTSVKKYFPTWLPSFLSKYKNTNINLSQYEPAALSDALKKGVIDIALTRSIFLSNLENISTQEVCKEKICLVAREDNPILQSPLNFDEVAKQPFILQEAYNSHGWREFVIKICENRGFKPQIKYSPKLNETTYTLLESGVGITFDSLSGSYYNTPHLKFIELDGDDAAIDFCVAWQSSNTNPGIKQFLDVVFEK